MDPPNPNPNLSALVDPHQYTRTRQMIQNARIYMDQMEAQNEAGFQAFSYTEQELQRRIREGREAEMLAAQLRAGNVPQQSFVPQQPQVAPWQIAPVPPPVPPQYVLPTSARIEEVPSMSSAGRSSRSGSHPTLQRNDSSSNRRSQQSPQSEVPRNANVSYGQSSNYSNVPVQTTTFISRDFYPGQQPGWQSYYNTSTTVPTPAVPVQQPPPPRPQYDTSTVAPTPAVPVQQPPPPPVRQPPPPRDVPVYDISGPQPYAGQNQPDTTRYDFVGKIVAALQRHSEDVQMKAIAQIFDYTNGKPTPNPQIRAWGDKLKQVGGPDPMELLSVVRTKLVEQRRVQQTEKYQTHQAQPQPQVEPLPETQQTPQPQSEPQSQPQPAQQEQPPQAQPTGVATDLADVASHPRPSEQRSLRNLTTMYLGAMAKDNIDSKRAGDILSVAYVSARTKQPPPKNTDIWVRRTLEIFAKHVHFDNLHVIFERLLQALKRPIPNIPLLTEPQVTGHSSSSHAEAEVVPLSNATPSTVVQQSDVAAQSLGNDVAVLNETPDVVLEAQALQSHDPAPIATPWTQAAGNGAHLSAPPSSPFSTIPVDHPYPTAASHHTTTVPGNATRKEYQPMEYNQLALVPRQHFYNVVPNVSQWQVPKQHPGWTPYSPPEASTSALPKRPPTRVRLPREADQSRLAKDILKQLGKPSGSVPAVPTRREYRDQKGSEAGIRATLVQPPAGFVVPEPRSLDHGGSPLPPGIVPVPDQVAPSSSYTTHPPETPISEPPLLEYPDPAPDPRYTDVIEQDVHMDIQPLEGALAPQPPASPGSNPTEDPVSPVAPGSAPPTEERTTVEHPLPSTSPPQDRRGPPPDAEIIEISDDEEEAATHVVTVAEPMEVDEEVGTGGGDSQRLSGLSPTGGDTLLVTETGEGRTMESLSRRPTQELIGRKPQKNLASVELPPLPAYARRNGGKERAPVEEDEEDSELQTIVDLAFSRLRPARCLWLGCRATLNSVDNLAKHLKIHVDETERTSDRLECQWKKCTRSYRTRVKLDRHCVHHAQKVLHCPYEDCDEEFRDAGELLDHTKDMHENSDLLPSTNPVPYQGRRLDALPEQVPSWTIFPVLVAPVPISLDRHGQIGRWVARNICGTAKRPGSSGRLRSSRRFDAGKQKSAASEREEIMNEERFGFLSSTDDGNTLFADIPSEAVSMCCRYGLVTLFDDGGYAGVARDGSRVRSEQRDIDGGDGAVRANVPAEGDVISLELEPMSSEDELLLKPSSQ